MFSTDQQQTPQNIVLKDMCTNSIQQSLNAKQLGQASRNTFVKDNLVDIEQPNKGKFHNSLLKNKAHTFSNLYNVQRKAAVEKFKA